MADYISREAAIEAMNAERQRDIDVFGAVIPECFPSARAIEALSEISAADVVSRDCYNRILAENDKLREENKELKRTTAYLTATTPKGYSGDWGNYG